MDIDKKLKTEAYDLIKTLYKFIPTYNKIKGTYIGIQFILNMMGLCASITELWDTKNNIKNFADGSSLYREEELNAVRGLIKNIGSHANVKNYYLTSRFDVDIYKSSGISFYNFNMLAPTIIDVVLSIKPVTRALRKLYYIMLVNTDIHFNYYLGKTPIENEIKTFKYLWNISENPLSYKTIFNNKYNTIDKLYLPYLTEDAIYYNTNTHTLKNSYFNLFELDKKLILSGQKTFRFKIYVTKSIYNDIIAEKEFKFILGDEVNIKVDKNGIFIIFDGLAKQSLTSFFKSIDFTEVKLRVASTFSIVLGTKYIYQDDNINLDFNIPVPEINVDSIIGENSTSNNPTYIIDELATHYITFESFSPGPGPKPEPKPIIDNSIFDENDNQLITELSEVILNEHDIFNISSEGNNITITETNNIITTE